MQLSINGVAPLVYPTAPLLTVLAMANPYAPLRYPVLQIKPYGLMVYERIEYPFKRSKKGITGNPLAKTDNSTDSPITTGNRMSPAFEANTGSAQYHGFMSPGSKKRLRRAIMLITAIAEPKKAMNFKLNKEFTFRLNFVTLTLPCPQGAYSDKILKSKILDPFLKSAKRTMKLRSYIWRAERQKNGNLHFHLITDTYLPYDQLRDSWNKRLNHLGYIDIFEKKHGHRHPNSTDVHATWNVDNLVGYFLKYMTKDEPTRENCTAQVPWSKPKHIIKPRKNQKSMVLIPSTAETKIDGKIWDCSKNLKHKSNCEDILEGESLDCWNSAVADPFVKLKKTDHCTMAFLSPAQFQKYVTGSIKIRYLEWLSVIRNIPDN